MLNWLLAFLGFAPGFLWLWFFLKSDQHPEPKKMLLKVFLFGAAITPLAVALEWLGQSSLSGLPSATLWYMILVVGPTEEILKYLVFKFKVRKSAFFDEPIDAMIYMITAAMGFATVENIILILNDLDSSLSIIILRFLSATLLHALASGLVGYFIGARKNIFLGLAIASFLHGLYNYLAITKLFNFLGLALLLVFMFFFIWQKLQTLRRLPLEK